MQEEFEFEKYQYCRRLKCARNKNLYYAFSLWCFSVLKAFQLSLTYIAYLNCSLGNGECHKTEMELLQSARLLLLQPCRKEEGFLVDTGHN
jgi:hypothetical protein